MLRGAFDVNNIKELDIKALMNMKLICLGLD